MLVHPGGPFWAKKDLGAWSIPKGLADEGEELLAAAKREFLEETGATVEAAKRVGMELAERAKKAGVEKVVFDRGSYMYHGRVKALADGAREGGLDF